MKAGGEMTMHKYFKMMLLLATAAWAGLFLAGCGGDDDDPNTSDLDNYFENHPYLSDPRKGGGKVVSISPDGATVEAVGDQVVFTASGGTPPYDWGLSNPSMGSVARRDNNLGVYTATTLGNNYVIVSDQDGNAAFAEIAGAAIGTLRIDPPSATVLSDDYSLPMRVSGGTEPYNWWTSDNRNGIIDGVNTNTTVVYRRKHSGDVTVFVSDGTGNQASSLISQP